MKRTLYVVGIVLALLVLMNVMTSCVKNSEKYADAVEIRFTETDNISFDKTSGRAKFDDGIISYSWDTSKWHFSLYNGTPQLEMPWNKFELKFTILSNDKGVANDFWNYAKQGLMDYYGESSKYVWSHMFASATDSYFNNKGYFGEQTGFYDVHGNKDSDTVKFNLAIELRLYDEKRRKVKVGDEIEFTEISDMHRKIVVVVIGLHKYSTFKELYKSIDLSMLGHASGEITPDNYGDMDTYYSEEEQNEYGVVGIEIKLLK